ncbi:MAG: hypothetical protein J5695_08775, partial [Bacteroidales bacterium]|nr:hypothetical protein [Bacteroidales bacterium]
LVSSKEPTLSLFSVLACTYLLNIFNDLFVLLPQKRDAKVVTFFGLANFFSIIFNFFQKL